MPELNEVEYYRRRERIERDFAAAAIDTAIAAIHADMANRYEALVEQATKAPRNGSQREEANFA